MGVCVCIEVGKNHIWSSTRPLIGATSIYILLLVQIVTADEIRYHSYADDGQLYITMSPGDNVKANQCVEVPLLSSAEQKQIEVIIFRHKEEQSRVGVTIYLFIATVSLQIGE